MNTFHAPSSDRSRRHLLAALLALCCCVPLSSADTWEDGNAHNRSVLTYSGQATILGRMTEFVVTFHCDTTAEKDMQGALGVDIGIKRASHLAEFPFGDFGIMSPGTRCKTTASR